MSDRINSEEAMLIDPINLRLSLLVPRLSEVSKNSSGHDFQWESSKSTPIAKEMLNRLIALAKAGMFIIGASFSRIDVHLNGRFLGENCMFFQRFFRLSDIEAGYDFNKNPLFLKFERRSLSNGNGYITINVRMACLSHNNYRRFITFDPIERRFGLSCPLMFYSNIIDIFNFLAVCKSELENLHTIENGLDNSTKEMVYDFFRDS